MTKGWRTGRLIDVATVSTGPFGSLLHKSDYVSDGVPLVNPINIVGELIIPDPGKLIDQATAHRLASYILRQGDIVVSRRGELGRCAAIGSGESGWVCGTGCFFIRPSSDIEPRFLAAMLRSDRYRSALEAASTGATMPSISNTTLSELLISIPERHAQQRIVAILDEAFAGIATAKANAKENLQNARSAFDSYLRNVFTRQGAGWINKSIDEIADIKGGKRVPKGYKLKAEPTEYPYLRVTDFLDAGTIDMSDLRYVSADVHRGIKRYIIRPADLYISIAGTIGKTGIIPAELDGANLTENACRLVFREGVSNRYVYFFTTTKDFMEQVGANTRTAAQPKLALSRLATIRLSLPSIEKQISLATDFDKLREETDHLEAIYTRKLAALDELKQSLLQQAFSGQLTRIHA